jgi:hypothetical protein
MTNCPNKAPALAALRLYADTNNGVRDRLAMAKASTMFAATNVHSGRAKRLREAVSG